MLLVVNDDLFGLASDAAYENDFQSRIRQEITDNYSYTLDKSKESERIASLSRGGTGNLRADAILSRYLPPRYIAWV